MLEDPTLAASASASTPGATEGVRLKRGDTAGRFVVIDELGHGAMGTVYAAFDVKLERQVALKLLNRSDRGMSSLLTEAQALARVNHPNVVTVYDVGEHQGRLYLAMELVDGQTLREWKKAEAPTWREIVAVYRKAARGLHAVHAADLVHGDFKPDNVMVASDGRVLVMDFGIARSLDRTLSGDDLAASTSGSRSVEISRIRGTPAYMAPEQFRLDGVGPASDQFAFCVSLYEALWGQRPFDGNTLAELSANVSGNRRLAPESGRTVPAWVMRVVERGLLPTPAQRWASMKALDDAFDLSLRRRMQVFSMLGAVGLTGVVAAALVLTPEEVSACEAAAQRLQEDVVAVASGRLRTKILENAHPDADAVWRSVDRNLEEFVDAWTTTNASLCAAGEPIPTAVLQARRACLDRQRDMVATTIELVTEAEEVSFPRASSVAATLPTPKACADLDDGDGPFDPHTESLERGHAAFSQAKALYLVGKREEAERFAAQALEIAESIDASRLATGVLLWRSAKRRFQGRVEGAREDALAAQRLAAESGSRRLAFLAWMARAKFARVHEPTEREAIAVMFEAAELELLQARRPADLRSILVGERGNWLDDLGRSSEALVLLDEALRVAERERLGQTRQADLLNVRGAVHYNTGDIRAALADFERSRDLRVAALGPHAPGLATVRGNIAGICMVLGDFDCARRTFAEIQRGLEASNDASSIAAAKLQADLAELARLEGRSAESEAHARKSIEISERGGFDEQPFTFGASRNILRALESREAFEEGRSVADDLLERARARFGETEGYAGVALDLAGFFSAAGEQERALALVREGRAIRAREFDETDPRVAIAWEHESDVLLDAGRLEDASRALDRADEILALAEQVTPLQRHSVRWTRIRIRHAAGETEAAIADAQALLADMATDSPDMVSVRQTVRDWLRENGVEPAVPVVQASG